MSLYQASIQLILENQSPSGAYIASPNFPTYRYSWFRDGAYIALAMDIAGEFESARRFHDWAADCTLRREEAIRRGIEKLARGEPLGPADILDTRYTLDGQVGTEEWTNFQLDGIGTWLWALGEHVRRAGMKPESLPEAWCRAADLAAAYLAQLWTSPCYDCWEEFAEYHHPYTLACIYGGLKAHSSLRGLDHSQTLAALCDSVLENNLVDGHFVKFPGRPEVDASLLGLAAPYGMFSVGDPRMIATSQAIETTLQRNGGVHRYTADTYYGGGAWILLTAWLGWYSLDLDSGEAGQRKALQALDWIERQANAAGWLPEQVPLDLNDPSFYDPWLKRWGPIANPLLWSHANYIILKSKVESTNQT